MGVNFAKLELFYIYGTIFFFMFMALIFIGKITFNFLNNKILYVYLTIL